MKVVEKIQFSLFSPEEMRKMSAAKIIVPDTYDEEGYPITGGLADQRLGVIDPGLKCKTCNGRMKDCGGHFGHIELVRPVIHVGFARTIYLLLKATCRKCGRLLNEESTLEKIKRVPECPHCGEKQKQIKFVKPTSYYEEERRILPNEVRERLEKITEEDVKKLGLGIRPEWMVLTVLLVPPVTVRPSITLETGERSEDDLTHKLVDILRINQRLGENIDAGAPQLIIEDLWELLQYHVATYFDNETAGIPSARHRSGRQLKTLFQRLKGKEGRFRYNLSGKRVNFSARTVVSPDPALGINEIGVPEYIARELTLPITVNEWNLEGIKEFIRSNSDKINYVIRTDGKRKRITKSNVNEIIEEIKPGYVIERQLMDGDKLIFNRQPSLHKISMMCHEAKILPGRTLRFNVADCKPYNADFDGDEMNIHLPQNEEATAEAEILMKVEKQILSPRHGEPIITPDQDHNCGLYLLTLEGTEIEKTEAYQLLESCGETREISKQTISGKELFSYLLPNELNMQCKNRICQKCKECKEEKCDFDAFIKIKNGKLVNGHIDSKVSDMLVKQIFLQFGAEEARKFIDAATKLSVNFLTKYGFSLSLEDYRLNEEGEKEVKEIYAEGRKKVRALIEKYKSGKLERQPGKTLKDTLEEQIMEVVEKVRDNCGKVVLKNINKTPVLVNGKTFYHNSALTMSKSGARGKLLNVVQMVALLGQQAVRGKRVKSGYHGRVLSHFSKGNLSDEARGFIKSNYKKGLTPIEYFFHACGGRDAVVDKGVNPAKTGYMQRRMINAMLDLIVHEDISVRETDGRIIQFKYGDDGKNNNGEPIEYGEPVGVIAAQSIGEPGTQMTLRTFHYAGVASLAQLGFTRLVEIVDARKTPKNPVMEIYLKKEYSKNYEKVKEIAASIEEITLEKIAEIQEDLNKKIVNITLDKESLKEKNIDENEVLKKISEITEYKKEGNKLIIKPKEENLKNIRKIINRLQKLHLKGIPGISRAIIIEKKDGELTLASEGSNLSEVLKIPEIDAEKTSTNDIIEIGNVLGIEAARNAIIKEIQKVMEAQELKVDIRHIMLVADAMTALGKVKSIGRHGIAGEKNSVIARAAFEETAKHLLNACTYGEEDPLRGITENIIIGQTIPCGTGKVNLVMNVE